MSKANHSEQRRLLMLNEPIGKVITKMAFPTIVAFLITSIYSLADTYFVSLWGGDDPAATAAVSVNASLDQLIMMCGSMLAMGANSYIARLLGEGKDRKASQVLSTSFFIAFGLGLMLLVFGTIYMIPMVNLLGATDTCRQYAVDYATYILIAAPFMSASFVMNQCLRSEGSATLSMIGMGFGGILNCILDPIFIFQLDMGVKGASLATAISKLVSFSILIFPYVFKRSLLRLSLRHFRPTWDIIKNVTSVGSSSLFRNGLAVIAAILLNNLADSDPLLAGLGVSNKIMMFPFCIILGFGNGFQPVAGFNWGARRYDRVQESYRFSGKVALIGAGIMALVIALGSDLLIQLFSGTDQEMRKFGMFCIITQCVALPIHAWVAIVNMFCVGLGNAKGALVLSIARQGTCFLPLLYPMSWICGDYGLCSIQALADVLSLGFAIPLAISMCKKVRQAQQISV